MRLSLVFLAVLFTRELATGSFVASRENFGVLVDTLLAVAENFSTCKTSESVLSVRDALENQQKTLRELLAAANGTREAQQCHPTHDPDQERAMELLTSQLQMVQLRCDAAESNLHAVELRCDAADSKIQEAEQRSDAIESKVKSSVDQIREEFKLHLRQEIEALNIQLLEEKQKNLAQDKSVEELRSLAVDLDDKVRELNVIVSSVHEDLNRNILRKGNSACPSPFLSLVSDCLYIHLHSKMNWDDARAFCLQIGGDLASPTDVIELGQFLRDNGHKKSFWIGATDKEVEGDFRWVTGAKMDLSTGWGAGEPNEALAGEDCVHYSAPDMLFNDNNCNNSRYFICQAQLL